MLNCKNTKSEDYLNNNTNSPFFIDPPSIEANFLPSQKTVIEGKQDFLQCIVDSNPEFNLQWVKSIDGGKTYSVVSGSGTSEQTVAVVDTEYQYKYQKRLNFKDGMQRWDSGMYKCRATNNVFAAVEKIGDFVVHCKLMY